MKLIVRALAGKCGICFNECFKKTQPKNSYEGGRYPEPERQERSTLAFMWDMWAPTSSGKKTTQISSM